MKDVSRIHKKLLQLSKKTMQIKWAKDLNRHLIKKDNKHIVKIYIHVVENREQEARGGKIVSLLWNTFIPLEIRM